MHKTKTPSHAKGGANKNMKKYPRIIDFLEVHEPKVYGLIDDLAMHGNFTPRRGGSITFLIPDSAYIAEIRKDIESDDPEKATDKMSSLILLDKFETPKDFKAREDDIPNLLEKKVVVKSVTDSKVTIDNGELTLNTKFRPFSRQGNAKRGNMAVWNLKGRVEYEKAPKATMKYLKGAKKGSTPSVEGGNEVNELSSIRQCVINEKLLAVQHDKKASDGNIYCPVVNAVTRLIRSFGDDPTYYEEYRRAKCLLTLCPIIDFYLLYCNPLVFAPDRVVGAYKKGIDCDRNVDTYKEFCNNYDHPALKGDPALLFKSEGVINVGLARDQIRNSFMNRITKDIGQRIGKVYSEVDSTNTLGNQSPVYSKGLAEVFSRNKGLHLLLDEFAYRTYMCLADVRSAPTSLDKSRRLKDAIDMIYESYGLLNNPEKKTKMDKPESYGLDLTNEAIVQCLLVFLKTWAWHVPCNLSHEFDDRVKVGAAEDNDPYSKELVDVSENLAEQLDCYDNCPCEMTPEAVSMLKAYMKSHGGRLPAGL
jgi:hypothetical protein